jgi:hypothetical protein
MSWLSGDPQTGVVEVELQGADNSGTLGLTMWELTMCGVWTTERGGVCGRIRKDGQLAYY